jgi:hypothetical protein
LLLRSQAYFLILALFRANVSFIDRLSESQPLSVNRPRLGRLRKGAKAIFFMTPRASRSFASSAWALHRRMIIV